MDDLEFRKRALANPHDLDADFVAAVAANPERNQFVDELKSLDGKISAIVQSVAVPAGLAERLKSRRRVEATPAEAKVTPMTPQKSTFRRYYALAASFVIAIGVTLSVGMQSAKLSAADLEFHDSVVQHVYREVSRYENGLADMDWQQINSVIAEAGGHLREDENIKSMHIKFANGCRIIPGGNGAHIVLEGSKGSISVIIVHSSPVTKKFDVNDSRFVGKIIPLQGGNLIIIGEKDEPLETYESVITDAFEWAT